jgi:hypothetical protein
MAFDCLIQSHYFCPGSICSTDIFVTKKLDGTQKQGMQKTTYPIKIMNMQIYLWDIRIKCDNTFQPIEWL